METDFKDKIIDYKLVDSTIDKKELLIDYKLSTIMAYADSDDKKEIEKIKAYVFSSIPKLLNKYKLIEIDNKVVGCLLVTDYQDGILLDELYLEEVYRGLGIGSSIINNILDKHSVVYLWVYKENNKAVKLYKRLGFIIDSETETRYFMKYVKEV